MFSKLYKLPITCLLCSFFVFFKVSAKNTTEEPILKPNVIIFYVDDLGWQDSELNDIDKPTPFETPNMLALAKKGMNFTQGYSPAPTCAPSRAGLLSGLHPAKTQLTQVLGARIPEAKSSQKMVQPYIYDHIKPEILTLPDALRDNGYKTGHVGKWHLGHHAEVGPLTAGFDFSFDGRGAHRNVKDRSKEFATYKSNDPYKLSDKKYPPFSKKHPKGISYPYDEVTENALSFVENNKSEPFFLYLAHWMVHYPTVTKNRDLLEYYTDKLGIDFPKDPGNITTPGQNNPYFASMVTTVDWSLGRLVSLLESTDDPRHPGKKLIETTYIFMTSDNGGAEGRGTEVFSDNAPLDMGKSHAQDGGIRVPMVITGPEVKVNTTNHNLINQLDYYPTILNLTNSNINKKDKSQLSGLDITNVLNGESDQVIDFNGKPRENLFWHMPHTTDEGMQSALRDGDFKLYKNHLDSSYELYRLYINGERGDFEEKFNIAGKPQYKNKLKELINKLETHLVANNAQYPHWNVNYKGSLPGKSEIPVINSSKFDNDERSATIVLAKGKTKIKSAYVLGEYLGNKASKKGKSSKKKKSKKDLKKAKKKATYEKLPVVISKDGLKVSAVIPSRYKEYVFALVDENNFLVISDNYHAK